MLASGRRRFRLRIRGHASFPGVPFEAMVINDMLSSIRCIARGIEVSDDTLLVAVIAEIGNSPGQSLGTRQTTALMESEFVYPRHADCSSPEDWTTSGGRGYAPPGTLGIG